MAWHAFIGETVVLHVDGTVPITVAIPEYSQSVDFQAVDTLFRYVEALQVSSSPSPPIDD